MARRSTTKKRAPAPSRRAKTAAERVAAREASRWGELLPPWILALVLVVATCAGWVWTRRQPPVAILLPIGVIVVGGVALWAVAAFSRAKTEGARILAYASVVVPTVIATWALIVGPLDHPVPLVTVVATIALCIAHNVRKAPRFDETPEVDAEPRGLEAILADHGVQGTRWKADLVDKDRAHGTGSIPAGATTDELQKAVPRLVSHLAAPPGSLAIMPSADNAREFSWRLMMRDLLKLPTPYDPSTLTLPRTPFDPIPIGLYASGEIATIRLADEDGSRHFIIAGMTGSGKSDGAVLIVAGTAHIGDIAWVAIDASKGAQTFTKAKPMLAWPAFDKSTGTAAMRSVRQAVTARADRLGQLGLKQWEPGCGMSYLVVLVEEASDFVDSDELEWLSMKARSAGVSLIVSLQYPSYKWIDPSVRGQFGTRLCFGVDGDIAESFMLDEEVSDAVASAGRPAAWRNSKPGYALLGEKGLDLTTATMPLRTFKLSKDHREIAPTALAYPARGVDPFTARALGSAYRGPVREDEQEAAARAGVVRAQRASSEREVEVVGDEDDELVDEDVRAPVRTVSARTGVSAHVGDDGGALDVEQLADLTIEEREAMFDDDDTTGIGETFDPGDPPTGLDAAQRMDRPTAAACRAALVSVLREAAERNEVVSVRQLTERLAPFSASRSHIYNLLNDMRREPVDGVMVESTDDGWRPSAAAVSV